MSKKLLYLAITAIICCSTAISEAITADEIVQNMAAAQRSRMENINDYTITTNNEVKYHKKIIKDGEPTFMTRTEFESGGIKFTSIYDGEYLWTVNPMTGLVDREQAEDEESALYEALEDAQLEYLGQERLNGYQTHILYARDLDLTMAAEDKHDYKGRIWIDAKDWVVRKMQLEMDTGRGETASMTIEMKDYRNFEGLLVPYLTEVSIDGAGAAMTPEEEEELRQNIAEMEKELAQMPEGQRQMIEQMMRPQMEAMKNLLEGDGILQTVRVKDVKVNSGLKDSLFDGKLLRK